MLVSKINKAFESTNINLEEGDIILEVNGIKVHADLIHFQELLNRNTNATIKLKIWRNKLVEVSVSVLDSSIEKLSSIVEWNGLFFYDKSRLLHSSILIKYNNGVIMSNPKNTLTDLPRHGIVVKSISTTHLNSIKDVVKLYSEHLCIPNDYKNSSGSSSGIDTSSKRPPVLPDYENIVYQDLNVIGEQTSVSTFTVDRSEVM
eukprot:CAMPEP_0116903854 /NCGR_PEP_ID=MMETSP0467-20121206/11014_1 /TAXON_ID=283647 /ORGANISM="Mesodinium pulex, Strain SPMC105" /LENGTH=202 /DNA_ID=CAMNT_0004578273 /DNA_START=897 /DNA_END=1505 /DNA_ORIENTATION=-